MKNVSIQETNGWENLTDHTMVADVRGEESQGVF